MYLQVKICCIASIEEAELAVRCGATALGLVSAMPSGPGVISEARIFEIACAVPAHISTFLLTSLPSARKIIEQHRRLRTEVIQICDRLPAGSLQDLRQCLPGIKLVQVVHVVGEESIDEAIDIAPSVDMILLDSGNQTAEVKELGGTGRKHDWSVSKRICEQINTPIFLAGGLSPENIAEAVRTVRPFGVDICTGVRTNGQLDEAKVSRFIRRACE